SGLRVGRGRVDGDVAAAHHRAGGRLPAPVVEALEGEQRAVGGLVVGVVHAALGAQAGGALGAVGGAAALGQPVGDAVQLDGAAVRGQLQVGAAGPQRHLQVGVLLHGEPAAAAVDLDEVLGP